MDSFDLEKRDRVTRAEEMKVELELEDDASELEIEFKW